MNAEQRVARLTSELAGTGAIINDPFKVWALDCNVTDRHIASIAPWADLDFLFLSGCLVTDASLPHICSFRRLKDLDISDTKITSNGIANSVLPDEIESMGVHDIPLSNGAAARIASLTKIATLNCNHCNLSVEAFSLLTSGEKFWSIEALGSDIPDEIASEISRKKKDGFLRLDSGIWKNSGVTRPPDWSS